MSKIYKLEIKKIELVEILEKANRPYLGVDVSFGDLSFLIPLRSNIDKRRFEGGVDCFPIKNSDIIRHGLDFTKTLIKCESILCNKIIINNSTHKEIKKNEVNIKKKFEKYIKNLSKDFNRLDSKSLNNKYKYCTLYRNEEFKLKIKSLSI